MEIKDFDRISYALGLSMGNNFKASGIKAINVQDFADGVAAVYNGLAPRMSYDEAKKEIQEYFTKMQAEQEAAQAQMAEVNAKAGRDFLEENGKRVEVKTTASGLQYEVIAEGKGDKPLAHSKVRVHYTGTLLDGTEFDSSVRRGEPAEFGVNQVIAGWTEALQLMSPGSKYRLFIPARLGYGEHGAGQAIPPNAALIFDVELLDIL